MKINGVTCSFALLLIAVAVLPQRLTGQTSSENTSRTRVVLLGTGQVAPQANECLSHGERRRYRISR